MVQAEKDNTQRRRIVALLAFSSYPEKIKKEANCIYG
jgi:hypothetical protein